VKLIIYKKRRRYGEKSRKREGKDKVKEGKKRWVLG